MKKKQLKQQRDELRNECDKLLCDLIDCEKEREALHTMVAIALKGLRNIYDQHEHIDNKYAQGAAKMAMKTLKKMEAK
jgi:uncharacterized coiled-coil DUF342 family protein